MASSVRVDGTRIRRLREERGIERWELAEQVGVTSQSIYTVEVYRQTTRPSTLRRIADALGVRPQDLVASRN